MVKVFADAFDRKLNEAFINLVHASYRDTFSTSDIHQCKRKIEDAAKVAFSSLEACKSGSEIQLNAIWDKLGESLRLTLAHLLHPVTLDQTIIDVKKLLAPYFGRKS